MFRSLVPQAMEDTLVESQFETSNTDIFVEQAMLLGRPWPRSEEDALLRVVEKRSCQRDAGSRGAEQ